MVKFWKRTILSILAILLINSVPVYASEVFYWNGIEVIDDDDESIILPENVRSSRSVVRGSILSTGIVDISDGGKGKVELTIQTLAHVPCDKICNALTLQVWNESLNDWTQVTRFEFEAKHEDNPNEELNYLINGVDVENLPKGIYRARGLHAVYLGDDYESFASRTNGIQIYR